jgi:hypothetical protein
LLIVILAGNRRDQILCMKVGTHRSDDVVYQIQQLYQASPVYAQLIQRRMLGSWVSPTADLLLNLVQFNVFRALVENAGVLSIGSDWMTDEAVSSVSEGIFSPFVPNSLQPTQLQRRVQHHPWLDLFPFAVLRDSMVRLSVASESREDDLCFDVVGTCGSPSDRTGLIVWRQPWDPFSWEASEGFLRKWGWTIAGCQELYLATNYWRSVRGDEPIDIEALVQYSIANIDPALTAEFAKCGLSQEISI